MSDTHRILIVDDSEENVTYFSEILEEHGYQYSVAKDGKEAMETMKESRPDLVLLDIMMPRRSGVVVYQQMKKNASLENVPIIVVTGASEVTGVDMRSGEEKPKETYDDDLTRGFGSLLAEKLQSMKPDGFIEKPVDPALLISKIQSLLN
jgi:CheY-like chemotaxis protein